MGKGQNANTSILLPRPCSFYNNMILHARIDFTGVQSDLLDILLKVKCKQASQEIDTVHTPKIFEEFTRFKKGITFIKMRK